MVAVGMSEPDPPVAAGPIVAAAAPVISTGPSQTKSRTGPMLRHVLARLETESVPKGMVRMVMDMSESEAPAVLPLSLSIPRVIPQKGEGWRHYKARALDVLGPIGEWMKANAGLNCQPVLSCLALQAVGGKGQIDEALKHPQLEVVELDPLLNATLLDDVVKDIELPLYQVRHPGAADGAGVRVAVLDSGIDTKHPWLVVAQSVSTCGESVDVPGRHGTHVAGCIASHDSIYGGVAPGVELLNIKVLDSAGRGQPTFITRGIDAALDAGAQVMSLSLGFNHLPSWSNGGQGWACPDGDCQLCRAVNTAVQTDGVIVVVAAGNEHERAEFLRNSGSPASFDTELGCPGQAREAITVGAITKETFLTASFSSRGPSAYGAAKPDIAAPGVNVTSALVAPRDPAGNVRPNLNRGELSLTLSGTSMAAPIITGAIALIRQLRSASGQDVSPAAIRNHLLTRGLRHLAAPTREVGAGRLNLSDL